MLVAEDCLSISGHWVIEQLAERMRQPLSHLFIDPVAVHATSQHSF